ncbi:hypothetical protein COU74_04595 [Candidatus Peregrinibacteria bacterium CG10_big_fil_rev_8_21_14_0_10_36_19]|nr:MAG: hypothetical protein COU74_04595 [Candidatus Peregrinibacteria bacterium CG10_big_fil_rev_8_21_14_0_10_36_19]
MKHAIKQFLISLGLTILVLIAAHGFETAIASAETLKNTTFDVSEILKLEGQDQPQEYFQPNSEGNSPIVSLILRIIEFATRIIGSIAVLLLIVSGFRMILSGGDQQKLDDAKENLKFAIIGLVVTFTSFVLVLFVQGLFTNAG